MGAVVDKIALHKTELFILTGILTTFYHLNKERKEKQELETLLKTALEAKQIGMKDF